MFWLIKKIFIGLLTGIVNWISIKNVWFNLPLLIYILMNTVKNFTNIHFGLD